MTLAKQEVSIKLTGFNLKFSRFDSERKLLKCLRFFGLMCISEKPFESIKSTQLNLIINRAYKIEPKTVGLEKKQTFIIYFSLLKLYSSLFNYIFVLSKLGLLKFKKMSSLSMPVSWLSKDCLIDEVANIVQGWYKPSFAPSSFKSSMVQTVSFF